MYVYVYAVVMGQKNSLHMVDPVTWSTRAAQLHVACGKTITLSEAGSVAQRRDATRQHKDGLVHTAWPVAVGRLFQVYIHNVHMCPYIYVDFTFTCTCICMHIIIVVGCYTFLISLINEWTRSRHSGPIMMITNANLECCHASRMKCIPASNHNAVLHYNTNQYFVMGLDIVSGT